jgi:WG containing repeat
MKRNSCFLLPCVFTMSVLLFFCPAYTQSLIAFKDAAGKYGFKNKSGKVVIAAKYQFADAFIEDIYGHGLIRVKLNDKWGLIDEKGKEIIPMKYQTVSQFFTFGWASVQLNNKWGFVDTTGKEVIPLKYDAIALSGLFALERLDQN